MTEIEQRRRDLKSSDPELYDYIARIEGAKVLDSAGDTASGYGQLEAANYLWGRASDLTTDSIDPPPSSRPSAGSRTPPTYNGPPLKLNQSGRESSVQRILRESRESEAESK